jgi:hypothetical protein
MWLRHFLSKDLPQCRTMIYGYNSKLSSRSIGTIEDYSREFLEGLKKVRGTKEVNYYSRMMLMDYAFELIILLL